MLSAARRRWMSDPGARHNRHYFLFIMSRSKTLRVAPRRRGGRVVECTALEMRHTGNRIGGSNPSLSATLHPFGLAALRSYVAVIEESIARSVERYFKSGSRKAFTKSDSWAWLR